MSIYTVHLKPEQNMSNQKPVFLKEGFNIAAFLLPLFWSLYQRMWFTAVLLGGWLVFLLLLARSGLVGQQGLMVMDIGMHVLVGFSANDWLRHHLSKKGYIMADVTVADSRLRAQQRYFDRCFAAA